MQLEDYFDFLAPDDIRIKERRATPKYQSIFEADPIGMGDKSGEQAGVGAVNVLHPAG